MTFLKKMTVYLTIGLIFNSVSAMALDSSSLKNETFSKLRTAMWNNGLFEETTVLDTENAGISIQIPEELLRPLQNIDV